MREREPAGARLRLRDGSAIEVRPIAASDAAGIRDLLNGLSRKSLQHRFLSAVPDLDAAASAAVAVDTRRRGLVATGPAGQIVGHAEYVRADHDRADIGVVVADRLRDRGLASALIARLAEAARAEGIHLFQAEVDPDNRLALDAIRERGGTARLAPEAGLVLVEATTEDLADGPGAAA